MKFLREIELCSPVTETKRLWIANPISEAETTCNISCDVGGALISGKKTKEKLSEMKLHKFFAHLTLLLLRRW